MKHVAWCLALLAGNGAAQSTVSIKDEPTTYNDPETRIQCPVGTAKRTDKTRIRDLYPELTMQFPPPPGYVPPRVLSPPKLEFPPRMHVLGVTGFVSIAFLIKEDGVIGQPQVLCSTSPDFEQQAFSSLPTMKFAPATQDGRRTSGSSIQPFNFALSD